MNPKPEYIDIHSHVNFPEYDTDRDEVIARMKEQKTWTITIGTNLETSESAIKLAETHSEFFACIGLHPIDDPNEQVNIEAFKKLITHSKVVAVGECGLDYGRKGEIEEADKARQKQNFEEQIALAVAHDKPLMLHVRSAHDDVLDILGSKKREYGDKLRGNSHFFSSGPEIAKRYLDLGFTCSFTGVITFVRDYDEAVKYVPLDMMMSETDAPFVAPVPYRGRRNEPIYVQEVVKRIAELKNKPLEEVKEALVANAVRSFNLK